jgi:acyl-CoA synthetase (NDP forming)
MSPEPRREKMPRQDLTPLLHAKSLAVVGVSRPGRFGGILYDNLLRFGYPGRVLPVNPRYETIGEQPCYGSLSELPERPDCALLALPNDRLVPALEEVAACGIPAAAIFASAYSEPAQGEPSLQAQLADVARRHGIVLCGPNCMGFVALGQRLPVSGYVANPETPAGDITLITHSGSVWDAFLQNQRGLAFNYIVSSGNEAVTTVADYMQFALAEGETSAIGLYLETVRDPDTFRAALAQAAEQDVPVVVLKTGRSERGAQLAQAHSGALAGEDAVYEALFAYYGVQRVISIDEMMDTLELFAARGRPPTRYIAAIHDSGGQRALTVDLAEAIGVEFAAISDATRDRIAARLEPGLEAINPLDAWGTGNGAEEIFAESLLALDADPATGLVLFATDLYPLDNPESSYPRIAAAVRERLTKPLAWVVHLSAASSAHQMGKLRDLGIPVLMGTETGLRAAKHLLEYSAYQRERSTADASAVSTALPTRDREALREQIARATGALGEHESKQVLAAYGLVTTPERRANDLAEALRAADEIGYPVVLKTDAGDLHKTERDGVCLDLADREALSAAYGGLASRLGPQVLVQQMVPPGVELLLGIVNDPQFGPFLTLGSGGIFVEVLKDVRMLMLPTTRAAIETALGGLRAASLLAGVRGRPPADLDAAVRAALSLSELALELGEGILEIDVNPLIVGPGGAVVADALIVPKRPERAVPTGTP